MYNVTIICTDATHPVNEWLDIWVAKESWRADVNIVRDVIDVTSGDFLFLISCHQIIRADVRSRFRHTLVLHASDLPRGRGMSPHIWQIVEGSNRIVLTMLNAEDALDSGDIWQQLEIMLDGTELYDEINERLFDAETALMSWALDNCDTSTAAAQSSEDATYYRRRKPADSEIDPTQSLADNFDLLRVADPSRYPAFFEYRGQRYTIRLEKART